MEDWKKQNSDRFRLVFERSNDAIIVHRVGEIKDVNKRACELTGYTREKLLSMSILDLFPEEYHEAVKERLSRCVRAGATVFETKWKRADGEIIDVEVNSGDFDPEEGIRFGITRDITERKKREEVLRESEERYRAIFEQAVDSILLIDPDTGDILEFNDRACHDLEYTREEFEKIKIADFEIFEDEGKVAEHAKKIFEFGADVFETKHRTKSGQIRNVYVNGRVISIGGKTVLQVIFRDITDIKGAEEAVRESEKFSSSLLESSSIPILVFNPDSSVKYLNPAFEDLTGFTSLEIIGKKAPYPWWCDDPRSGSIREMKNVLFSGAQGNERIFQKKNGERFWVTASTTPFRENGELKYVVGDWIDITERKQAEENLRKSEEKERRIAEVNKVLAEIGRIVSSAPSIEDVFEKFAEEVKKIIPFDRVNIGFIKEEQETYRIAYTAGLKVPGRTTGKVMPFSRLIREVLQRKSGVLIHAESENEFLDDYPEFSIAFNAGIRSAIVIPMISKDRVNGVLYFASLSSEGFSDNHLSLAENVASQIEGAIANARLYDEIREAEEALREGEARYRSIFEDSPTIMLIHDPDTGRFIDVNQAACSFYGYSRDRMIGMKLEEITHGHSKRIKKRAKETLAKDRIYFEAHHYTRKGERRRVEVYNNVVTIAGKKVFTSIIHDITERKAFEKALKESEEKYRSMMESMKESTYICSPDMRIEYMNPAMVDRVGVNAIGEKCHMAIYGRDEICPWCVFDKVQEKKHVEYEMVNPKDDRRYSVTNSPISHDDGTVSKLTIFRDITEIKTMEETLSQAQKMESIGTLTGGIAHDFNNILGIIIGNAELALCDVPESSAVYSSLEEIKRASLRATKIVKQLLSFSRKTDRELQSIEIIPVIKEALVFLRSTIPTTVEIQENIQAVDETIIADPTQINQIIMNLCINASQAMEKTGGSLTVNVENVTLDEMSCRDYPGLGSGRHIAVTIKDTGPGIAPEIIDRIFDPYFTTKEVGKGSGMGLAVVLGIVKNHHGAISVVSTPGEGTSFIVLFPVTTQKPEIEKDTPEEPVTGSGTVLFVDDEESIVRMVKKMLDRLGYDVRTATDPLNALEQFRSDPGRFDLVLTDMTMPKMTGVSLAEKIMETRPDIPVIICTGHSDLVDEERAKHLGIAAYVMKPINMTKLAMTVRKELSSTKVLP